MQKKRYFKSTPVLQLSGNQNNYSLTHNIDQLIQNEKLFLLLLKLNFKNLEYKIISEAYIFIKNGFFKLKSRFTLLHKKQNSILNSI
jgi:hypothetical protein